MAVDLATFALLAKPLNRQLFETVVKERSIRFADLLRRASIPDNNRDNARLALQELKDARLIKELAPMQNFEDFNTYYVTADGLEASRQAGL